MSLIFDIRKEREKRWELFIVVIFIALIINVFVTLFSSYIQAHKPFVLLGCFLFLVILVVILFNQVYSDESSIEDKFKVVIVYNKETGKPWKDPWGYKLTLFSDSIFKTLKDYFLLSLSTTDELQNLDHGLPDKMMKSVVEHLLMQLFSMEFIISPGYDGTYETQDIIQAEKRARALHTERIYLKRESKAKVLHSLQESDLTDKKEYESITVPKRTKCTIERSRDTTITLANKFFTTKIIISFKGVTGQLVGIHPVIALIPIDDRYNLSTYEYQINYTANFNKWLLVLPQMDKYYDWVEQLRDKIKKNMDWIYFSKFLPSRSEVELRLRLSKLLGKEQIPYEPGEIGDLTFMGKPIKQEHSVQIKFMYNKDTNTYSLVAGDKSSSFEKNELKALLDTLHVPGKFISWFKENRESFYEEVMAKNPNIIKPIINGFQKWQKSEQ